MTDAGATVLVVEDEPQLRRFMREFLVPGGYRPIEAAAASEARILAASHNPEIILLDLGLPDGDGIALTRHLREWSRAPIIVVSARNEEDLKVQALDAGADDFVTKPVRVSELLARMRAALRRRAPDALAAPVVELGRLRVDLARREVMLGEHELRLSPIEYQILALLAQNAGTVVTQRDLLERVWGPNQTHQAHYLRVYVRHLRTKIEANPARPRMLVTVAGVGYRLQGGRGSAPAGLTALADSDDG